MLDRIKDIVDPPIGPHRIFFFHIAKCGGTSIAQAIETAYKPWRAGRSTAMFRLDEAAARFADDNSIGMGNNVRRDLLNYALSLPAARCVVGHFSFSNNAFEKYRDSWQFVTVLRNPIERWLSHYSYNLNSPSKYSIEMTLAEFVETDRARNFGRAYVDEVTDDLDKEKRGLDELINIAIGRFKNFALVGAVEKTPEFAERFNEKFGYRLDIKRLNETPAAKRVAARAVPPELLARIAKLCEPDIFLYEQVLGHKIDQRAGAS